MISDFERVRPGAVFTSEDRERRVVVYYVAGGANPCVFADCLPLGGGSGYCGGNPRFRFLRDYPRFEGQMRFEGAWKLYKGAVRGRGVEAGRQATSQPERGSGPGSSGLDAAAGRGPLNRFQFDWCFERGRVWVWVGNRVSSVRFWLWRFIR